MPPIGRVLSHAAFFCVAVGLGCSSEQERGPRLESTGMALTGKSSPAGPLSTRRFGMTLTKLQDGRVLAAGGHDGTAALASCEVFDPSTATWSATGALNVARAEQAAALLPDGRVLAAGGFQLNGTLLASSEIYDPATGQWTPTGDLPAARRRPLSSPLPGGNFLVAFGTVGDSANQWTGAIYDPSAGTWAATASAAWTNVTGQLLGNGLVLGIGSIQAQLFDPSTGRWRNTGAMGTTIGSERGTGFSVNLLGDGRVLVAGGSSSAALGSAEIYDPTTQSWSATARLGTGRYNHQAVSLADGTVLVLGGFNNAFFDSVEQYDPATGSFAQRSPLLEPRSDHRAVLLDDGRVLVAGGQKGSNGYTIPLTSTELYDPSACIPTTCAAKGKNCGELSDGCGGTLACGTCGGGLSCNVNVCADLTPPDVAITSPADGATLTGTVTFAAAAADAIGVTRLEFYDGSSLIGIATFTPASFSWNTATAANGGHTLTVKAYDAAGNVGSRSLAVTVDNPPALTAAYDSALQVPWCASVGSSCSSGSLLNGVGSSEVHNPNTLNSLCRDGAYGSYHSTESVDAIRVSTSDGSALATGKQVTIQVTVWVRSYYYDRLDLYGTTSMTGTSWIKIATLSPSANGLQTLSTTYVLPSGPQQAIRAGFRYAGYASACSTGSYDDHDDLAFTIE